MDPLGRRHGCRCVRLHRHVESAELGPPIAHNHRAASTTANNDDDNDDNNRGPAAAAAAAAAHRPLQRPRPQQARHRLPHGRGLTDLSSSYSDGFNDFDKSKTYSNNDNICYGTGEVDDQGTRIGGYCTLAALADCSVVWGIADSGDSASDVFSGQQLYDFLHSAQKTCGNGPAAVISTTSSDPNDDPGGWDYSFCLVHPGQENACGTNQGNAVP